MNMNYIKNWKGNLFKMKFHCGESVCLLIVEDIYLFESKRAGVGAGRGRSGSPLSRIPMGTRPETRRFAH